jgi:hypothetical protein
MALNTNVWKKQSLQIRTLRLWRERRATSRANAADFSDHRISASNTFTAKPSLESSAKSEKQNSYESAERRDQRNHHCIKRFDLRLARISWHETPVPAEFEYRSEKSKHRKEHCEHCERHDGDRRQKWPHVGMISSRLMLDSAVTAGERDGGDGDWGEDGERVDTLLEAAEV